MKAIAIGLIVWGAYAGINGVKDLRDGVKHIQDSRTAAIEQATNY